MTDHEQDPTSGAGDPTDGIPDVDAAPPDTAQDVPAGAARPEPADQSADNPADPDDGPDDGPDDIVLDAAPEATGPDADERAQDDDGEPGEPDAAPDAGGEDDGPAPAEEPDAPAAQRDHAAVAVPRHGGPAPVESGGWAVLGRALRPRLTGSQVVVGFLCAVLGFALVVQLSLTEEDQLSSLRQSDLVRLLDEVTQRSGELEDQVQVLEATRDELASGSGRQRAALEVAEQQAQTQGILSGRLPAQGPGVTIDVDATGLDAFSLFNILEELRNAGAEAIEVNGVRLVASSYFEDRDGGIVVDGQPVLPPYRWVAIGDSATIATALEIPGGAMASVRAKGASTTVTQEESLDVTATTEPATPRYATPAPKAGEGG